MPVDADLRSMALLREGSTTGLDAQPRRTVMPLVHFNKATDPAIAEKVHINTDSILFVEKCHGIQIGKTAIKVMGLEIEPIRVDEPLSLVLAHLPGLIEARRHYLVGGPPKGSSVVHVSAQNISYLLPNTPQEPAFWTAHFKDASELCIMDPLPPSL